jgi:hypothetical protein
VTRAALEGGVTVAGALRPRPSRARYLRPSFLRALVRSSVIVTLPKRPHGYCRYGRVVAM